MVASNSPLKVQFPPREEFFQVGNIVMSYVVPDLRDQVSGK